MTFVSSGADGAIAIGDVATGTILATFHEDDWIMSLHTATVYPTHNRGTKDLVAHRLLVGSHNGQIWEFDIGTLEKIQSWLLPKTAIRRFATHQFEHVGSSYTWDIIVANAQSSTVERWMLLPSKDEISRVWTLPSDTWALRCLGSYITPIISQCNLH
jgi:WD40 repeat protein